MQLRFNPILPVCLLVLLFTLHSSLSLQAQTQRPHPSPSTIAQAPWWAQEMYSPHPNVHQVDSAFMAWRKKNPVGRTYHTQFYKHWRRAVGSHLSPEGYWAPVDPQEDDLYFNNWLKTRKQTSARSLSWENIGPFKTYAEGENRLVAWQVNVYCLDQSVSDSTVLFIGTENGLVFKTTDGGNNWTPVAREVNTNAILAVKIHPANSNIVYFADNQRVFKTTNGGTDWEIVLSVAGLEANDISINPDNPDIVMVAAGNGLHRSTDGGATWVQVFTQKCWDMEYKTDDPNTVFLLKNNPSTKLCEFFKSGDRGENWTKITNGWIDPAANSTTDNADDGARLAVTKADPNRLYAVLLGQYNDGLNDNNYLGVWRSNDAGESWTLPNANVNGGPGAPYAGEHTCLVTFWFDEQQKYPGNSSEYNQGFYNLGLDVSDTNPDKFLVGFLNLFKSEDGGVTFKQWGGYGGGPGWQHPDIQDIDIHGEEVWVSSDGGLNKYAPNFGSHVARNVGVAGSDFWGFDCGWNEDVMTGGRYHNGNTATIYGTYPNGEFIRLGGAEATTGYVHPAGGRKVMHSDISPQILPLTVTGQISGFSFSTYPNEGYAGNNENSSEIEPDPRCYNHLYLGQQNTLQKSLDGGLSWSTLKAFGNDESRIITGIEVSRSNPDVIYCLQHMTTTRLWRSANAGQDFTLTSAPPGGVSGAFITLDPLDENHLWLAWSKGGASGEKVFETTDGGTTWSNLTTSTLNGHFVEQILHIGGTDGGIYLATNLGVFYRSQSESDWIPVSEGLPAKAQVNRLLPFYAKSKVRIATYGRGIWQSDFYEMPAQIVVQPTVDKLVANCARDTFYFDDYSMVDHSTATWEWSFEPAPQFVSNASLRNPKVVFGENGTFTATMTLNGSFVKSIELSVNSICDAEAVPGNALSLNGTSDHATAASNLSLNTNTLTISCWVKPDPVQNDRAALVFARGGSTTAGIGFSTGTSLSYHWNNAEWWWEPGLKLTPSTWSHVALVVEPDAATIYLNGVGVTNLASHDPEAFDTPILIGLDPGTYSRRFKGLIDEVAIWKKALTQEEIRELMHLTKIPAEQPDLVSYYQFNEVDGEVLDRTGVRHLAMVGNASRTTSTAPLGGGVSARLTLNEEGLYAFGETGFTIAFGEDAILPDGEVVVSRLNLAPDQLPNASSHSRSYWVVDNYGDNFLFDAPDFVRFEGYGNIQSGEEAPSFVLYTRGAFEDGDSWGSPQDVADELSAGTDGSLTFSNENNIEFFGQYVIMQESMTGVADYWQNFRAALLPHDRVRLYWVAPYSPGVSHFILEKSTDGVDFQFFEKINAHHETKADRYQAFDTRPFRGQNFYRLKQLDSEGRTTFSAVCQITVDAPAGDWSLFPNPLAAGQPLEISTNLTGEYRLLFYDAKGRVVLDRKLRGTARLNHPELPAGVYGYQIVMQDRRWVGKIVIE